MKRRCVATIEARMTSSRLPGKILMPLAGKPSLERMVERIRLSKQVDEVVVATTVNPKDDSVEAWAKKAGVAFFRGSEDDVLLRVLEAAKAFRADVIVELCGDCPLIDPTIIDEVLGYYLAHDYDYVSNSSLGRSYPLGFDVKIFSTKVLEEVNGLTQDQDDHEHVSLYIYEHPERYKLANLTAPPELHCPNQRLCVDTLEDFKVVRSVYNALYESNPRFSAPDILRYLQAHPEIAGLNAQVQQRSARNQNS
ncbi:MAG: spore coat biosynthesis protein F [Omnitrophica bacterium RIFCSPHIGHO2_02_FULL_51_18]|nr:MAG: spore coat biosynthesis protein F [Omnitrophica bacterium RIFCSPHIGHO2_02_FULL_51_18]